MHRKKKEPEAGFEPHIFFQTGFFAYGRKTL